MATRGCVVAGVLTADALDWVVTVGDVEPLTAPVLLEVALLVAVADADADADAVDATFES
jgi:hypothetical protein